jgi:hypothetical protein
LLEKKIGNLSAEDKNKLFKYPLLFSSSVYANKLFNCEFLLVLRIVNTNNISWVKIILTDIVTGEKIQESFQYANNSDEAISKCFAQLPDMILKLQEKSKIQLTGEQSNKNFHKKESGHWDKKPGEQDFSAIGSAIEAGYFPCPICFSKVDYPLPEIGREELKIQEEIRKSIESRYKIKNDFDLEKRVTAIVDNIIKCNYLQSMKIRLKIIDSRSNFLFSMGNGEIYISTGLIKQLKSDENIASAISCELAGAIEGVNLKRLLESGYISDGVKTENNSKNKYDSDKLLENWNFELDEIYEGILVLTTANYKDEDISEAIKNLWKISSGKKRESREERTAREKTENEQIVKFNDDIKRILELSEELRKKDPGYALYIKLHPYQFVKEIDWTRETGKIIVSLSNVIRESTNNAKPAVLDGNSMKNSKPNNEIKTRQGNFELIPMDKTGNKSPKNSTQEGVRPPEKLNPEKK